MAFFNSAVNVLQTLVIALGAGLGIWGVINLLEGYGNDNPGAKSQGMKQKELLAQLQVRGVDLNASGLSKLEGQIRFVTDFELLALSDILNVSVYWLLTGEEKQ